MQRRDFLKLSTGTAFAGVSLLSLACTDNKDGGSSNVHVDSHGLSRIGVQLYTVRELMQQDFEGTIEKVAQFGYKEVEFAGYYGHTAKQVRTLLDRLAITAPAAHVGMTELRSNLDEIIATSSAIGHKFLVCPSLPDEERTTEHFKRHAAFFNQIGQVCKTAGIRFAYHNHAFEFEAAGDETNYDILLKETDPDLVDMELDLYWIKKGGYEPLDFFTNYPGRFKLCHVKDMNEEGDMVAVGEGGIDFVAIFAQAKQAGLLHFIVEHDHPSDALQSIATSYNYLKDFTFS